MGKKKLYKANPKVLSDCAPGKKVFIRMCVGNFESRVRVAWHWKDGAVCVIALQLGTDKDGRRLRTTFAADTPIRECLE